MSQADKLREAFLTNVPTPVISDTVQCLLKAYQQAYEHCRETFTGVEGPEIYPHYRRACFEQSWRTRLARYDGVECQPRPNAARNCSHTEVACGKVTLTVSAVERSGAAVRHSVFRESLAQGSQLNLLRFNPDVNDLDRLYAVLIHGPLGNRALLQSPSFLYVAFPEEDGKSYRFRFDILDLFPEVAPLMGGTKPITVEPRKLPTLRKAVEEEEQD